MRRIVKMLLTATVAAFSFISGATGRSAAKTTDR